MLENFLGYEAKRKRLLRKAPAGAMSKFLSVPMPDRKEKISQVPILSVDFETTGLNPKKDQILSIGYVLIENNEIKLSSATHQIIQTDEDLTEQNVIIHQITDLKKSRGDLLKPVIDNFLSVLAGKVMLVHFSKIESSFLKQACLELYGIAPVIPMIDTLDLAKRRLDKRPVPYDPSELRLFNLRDKYALPRYTAHNALSDAIATAELFFAERAIIGSENDLGLSKLLTRSFPGM